jgi:hypothetical protein
MIHNYSYILSFLDHILTSSLRFSSFSRPPLPPRSLQEMIQFFTDDMKYVLIMGSFIFTKTNHGFGHSGINMDCDIHPPRRLLELVSLTVHTSNRVLVSLNFQMVICTKATCKIICSMVKVS